MSSVVLSVGGEAGFSEKLVTLLKGKPDTLGKAQSAAGLGLAGVLIGDVNGHPTNFSSRRVHLRSPRVDIANLADMLGVSTLPGKLFEDTMTERLETVNAVITFLYGKAADAARHLDRSRTAIWKYQQRNQLPGDLYVAIQRRARRSGYEVPDELFTPVSVHPRFVNHMGE